MTGFPLDELQTKKLVTKMTGFPSDEPQTKKLLTKMTVFPSDELELRNSRLRWLCFLLMNSN